MDVERKKYRESIRVELISWGFDFFKYWYTRIFRDYRFYM